MDCRSRRSAFEELEARWLLATNFVNIANSLNSQLLGMQNQLTAALNNYNTGDHSSLPYVGESLGSASQIVNRFNSQLQSALAGLGTLDNPSDSLIQNALASVPFLVDRNGNGVGPDDVLITRPGSLGSEGFAVQMRLQGAQTAASTLINFNTGLPGLPVNVTANGTIDVSVGFAYELAFTYNSTNTQVALDSTKNLGSGPPVTTPSGNHPLVDPLNPLAIFVTAGLAPGFNASATVGFVKGTAAPIAGQTNALYATALVNNLTGTPTIKVDGGADANLRLTGSFAGTGNDFPGIDADFHLHWALSSSNPGASAPEVVFDNVHLNLGKFISNVVGPVFEAIQDATDPLAPVLEVLDYPLPGITDLSQLVGGGEVSLLDIGGVVAPFTGFGPLYDLVHQVIDITNQIRDLDIAETVRMPLGGFDLDTYDLRSVAPAGSLTNLDLPNLTSLTLSAENLRALGQTFEQIVAGLDVGDDVKAMLGELTAGLNNGFDIRFPILDTPQDAVFGLLLGRDSDLFTLHAEADFDAQGSLATGLSVFGLGVTFDGEVSVDTKFKFAYDTYGLRVLMNNLAQGNTSHIADDILDGFYIGSDSFFNIGGRISAGVGASIGIFSATVGGFVSTDDNGNDPVSITITDPNSDGKLRFAEVEANPFNMSGRLSAALGIEVAVGYDPPIGPFIGWRERFDIASVVIVDLDNPPEPGAPPIVLASQPDVNGTIQLYIGEQAHLRSGPNVSQTNSSEHVIIRNIKTTGDSETIEIALRQEDSEGDEYWVRQEIAGVKWINGAGDVGDLMIDVLEGVNVNVHFEGGQGTTDLRYHGTGSAHLQAGEQAAYLSGGQGGNTLLGGPVNDTIVLGPGSNLVAGGLGDNMIVLSAPYTQSGLVFGGSDPAAHNTAVVISGDDRWRHLNLQPPEEIRALPGNENSIQLNYRAAGSGTFSPSIFLSGFKTLSISGEDRVTDITIGDLSSAGVTQIFVNIPSSGGGRDIDLATRASGGATQITLNPFLHTFPDPANPAAVVQNDEMQLVNATTGVTTYLFGTTAGDVTTIHHHGGSIHIGQLAEDAGTIFFDVATRQVGVANTVTMTTPAITQGNQISTYANALGQFVVDAINYPTLIFHGLATIDSMAMNLGAPGSASGINDVDIDASVLRGSLVVGALGDANAKNDITLSHVGTEANVAIHGGNTTSSLLLATGQLAAIKTNVTATNVQLSVDNSAATLGSLLTLTASTFGNWLLPGSGVTPRLNFSGLRGPMEIFAGAGDRYQLDVTPVGVTSLTMHNDTATLDPVYTANWAVPLVLLGNFAFYAGQRLMTNGAVERVKRLVNVGVPVTLNFSGNGATEVVLDGDLDAPGAQYTIGGNGNLHVANQTVGLSVNITGFRSQDELYIYMPGASVAANLQRTSPGTIYFDSTARQAGTNATAPNSYTIEARYGQTELRPLGQYDSLLDMFNDVYLLGSLPQDSLTVNVPTHVRITAAKTNAFDLESGKPNGWAVVHSAVPNSFIAWKEGTHPEPFVFGNVVASQWDEYYAPGMGHGTPPNPFVDFAYGTDVAYIDAPLSVEYFGNFSPGLHAGTGRYFLVDPNPVATDNDVQLDASQLRGSFAFNVTGPDYNYVKGLVRDALPALGSVSVWYNGFGGYVWGTEIDFMRIALGQSNIVLSHVNPQLSVGINSQNIDFAYPPATLASSADGGNSKVLKSAYPVTSLNVGAGTLANIQGNLSVQGVALTVDDSAGTAANNLILTGTTFTGWATAAGSTQPILTMSALENRPLTLIGGALDRFGIENFAATAGSLTVRNLATSGTHAEVYVMAKPANRALNVTGNFDLSIGRRLNANGSVSAVGQVSGVLPGVFESNPGAINYDFRGQGHGLLVYDAANHIAPDGDFGQMVITSHASDPTKGRLMFDHPKNLVVYGGNTDIEFYGPTIQGSFFERTSLFVDQRLAGTVRYVAGPTNPNHKVRVLAAFAPLYIQGAGPKTRVELDPTSGVVAFTNQLVLNTPGNDLKDTIIADVTVTNAQLTIRPDVTTTPAPIQLKNVVISADKLTGIAGAPIHYSNLQDVPGFTTIPSLIVQMPRHSADLTILGTPAGSTTGIHVVGLPLGNVQVLGTNPNGRLALGSLEATDFRFVAPSATGFNQTLNFAAQSLNVGDGNAQNIRGEVLLGAGGFFTTTAGTVIDNRNDTLPRTVSIFNSQVPVIQGLAPAPIRMRSTVTGGLSIYGSAGSQFTVSASPAATSLYAGQGSTVDLSNNSRQPNLRILGAGTVNQLSNFLFSDTGIIRIESDPARPNDVTQLIDRYLQSGNGVLLEAAGDGMYRLVALDPFQQPFEYLLLEGNTTHVTLQGGGSGGSGQVIQIAHSPLAGADVFPALHSVEVRGTTGPVQIHQGTDFFGSTMVVLGNAGNMQAILGEVTVASDNPFVQGGVSLQLNNSADAGSRTVTAAYLNADHWRFSGLAPAAIHAMGNRVSTSLLAGAGDNTLIGPDIDSVWEIDAAGHGTINGGPAFSGFANIGGGDDDDLFRLASSSSNLIIGDLDGGGGFNTLEYLAVPSPFVTDLVAGNASLVGGSVQNIHAVIPEQLTFNAPSSRSDQAGDAVSLQLSANSTLGGTLTFGASGLPGGLSINPSTGLISGTLADGSHPNSPYQVVVTVSDGTNSRLRTIEWEVLGDTPQLPGDYNSDGRVDAADYVLWRKTGGTQEAYDTWRANYGSSLPPASHSLPGDYNQDNVVSAADYVVWRKTLGTQEAYDTWRGNFGSVAGTGGGAGEVAPGAEVELARRSAPRVAPRGAWLAERLALASDFAASHDTALDAWAAARPWPDQAGHGSARPFEFDESDLETALDSLASAFDEALGELELLPIGHRVL